MPRFRVIHKISGEEWEVEATCLEDARKAVGWPMGVCRILMIRRGPFAEILPPKVAVQLSPPHPGSEKDSQDFWWQCPSCDQLYHEWENKFYKNLEG
jgi:hypothetical protein